MIKILKLVMVIMLIVSIVCQSNNYVNIKFEQNQQSLPKNVKTMTMSQLMDMLQKNPQNLLQLKDVYISGWPAKNVATQTSTSKPPTNTLQSTTAQTVASQQSGNTMRTTTTSSSNLRTIGSSTNTQNPVTNSNASTVNRTTTPPTIVVNNTGTTISAMMSQPSSNAPINDLRLYMIYLTNTLRKKYNAKQLIMSPLLNKIAQDHSNDMARRNFFDHVNPDGERVGDRAQRNGYQGAIGQNLAYAPNLNQAQIGFERSQTHFTNAINTNWEEMGVGIAFKGSMMYVTCVFTPKDISRTKLSTTEIQNYRLQLANAIVNQSPNRLGYDQQLSQYIQEWLQGNRSTPVLNYVTSRGQYRTAMTASQYTMDYTTDFVSRAIEKGYFQDTNYYATRFGIGMVQNGSKIQTYVVYM